MRIIDLIPMQNGLRDGPQIFSMIDFVKAGGRFNEESLRKYRESYPDKYQSSLIRIVKLPDDKLYIGDGHHRIVSIWIGDRSFLHHDEYFIVNYSYEEFLAINFERQWITPLDLRTEIRFANFFEFKSYVYEKLEESEEVATKFIYDNRDLYAMERDIYTVDQLAASHAIKVLKE